MDARPQSLSPSLALQSAVAAVVFTASGRRRSVRPADPRSSGLAVGWLVVLAGSGGYGTYLFVVRRSGATRASTLLYLTPPTTAVWAWLLLGQTPQVLAVPGASCAPSGSSSCSPGRHAQPSCSVGPDQQFVDGDPPRPGDDVAHGVGDVPGLQPLDLGETLTSTPA